MRIPAGWLEASLNDTGLFINGLAFKPTDWASEGRRIIRIQNLSGKSSDYNLTPRQVSPDNIVNDGDLLVSWSATLDAYTWRGDEGVLNQHIFKVVPNSAAVTAPFLYWLLKHEVRQLAQSQHAHGLAMMHINRGPFLAHQVLLPSLEEQQEIVAKIDELMVLCDKLAAVQTERETRREALQAAALKDWIRVIAAGMQAAERETPVFLRQFSRMMHRPEDVLGARRAVLMAAVSGRLVRQDAAEGSGRDLAPESASATSLTNHRGKDLRTRLPALPSNWVAAPWKAIGRSQNGRAFPSGDYSSGGTRLLRPGNLHASGNVVWTPENTRYMPNSYAERFPQFLVGPDELIMNLTAQSLADEFLGRVCVTGADSPPALLNQRIARLSPHRMHKRYMFWVLKSPLFRQFADQLNFGAFIQHMYTSQLDEFTVPVPPLPEQQRIVAKVDELMAVCDGLEKSLAREQAQRSRLLEAILRDALQDGLPHRRFELVHG